MTKTKTDKWRSRLRDLAKRTLAELNKGCGNRSVCSLKKQGRNSSNVKYLEGRAAVGMILLTVARQSVSPERILEELDAVEARNRALQNGVCGSVSGWQAYFNGVSAMVTEAREICG